MSHSGIGPASIRPRFGRIAPALFACLLSTAVTGCAAVPLEEANTLTSYDGLTSNNGKFTKAKFKVDPGDLVENKTIYIEPTTVSPNAAAFDQEAFRPGPCRQCDQPRPLRWRQRSFPGCRPEGERQCRRSRHRHAYRGDQRHGRRPVDRDLAQGHPSSFPSRFARLPIGSRRPCGRS